MDSELLDFVKSDGTVYPLHSPPSRMVLSNIGWGKPGETFSKSSGPFQHGETPVSYRLSPRVVQLSVRHKFRTRQEYWAGRSSLLAELGINNASPNAPTKGVLRRKYYQDNLVKTRCLDVFLKNGLVFEQPEGWQEYSLVENLEFIADNPVIYDPLLKTSTISSFSASLVLPVTFPFILGSYYGSSTITYTGTWESYPTITVVGPATDFYIENLSTGAKIRLFYNVSAGETVTFDLSYDTKTVTNNLGQNLAEYLRDSDLSEFCITHLVSSNLFLVSVDAYGTGTSVTLSYYNRYYGI